MHEHLLDTGRRSFVATVKNVVQQCTLANWTRMRRQVHACQFKPMVKMGKKRGRIVVSRNQEKVTCFRFDESTHMRLQSWFHIVCDSHDVLFDKEIHDAIHRLFCLRVILLRRAGGRHRCQTAIALLFELQ